MKPIRRLLAIRLSALGDICMTLPVIDSFCRAYPDVELTLLTSKPGAAICRAVIHQPNLRLIAINKKDYSGLSGLNRLYHEMQALQFDAVADLHDVLRTKWVRWRFGLRNVPVKVIDKGRREKKQLLSHRINEQLTDGFTRYARVFRELGFTFDVDYQGASHRMASTAQPLSLGIAPFAQHQGKIYPIDQMYEVIKLLIEAEPSLHIYLFGGPEDSNIVQPWADAHPDRVTNMAGKQTFADDLSLMSGLRLMLSMDSANMHLASLVGIRCLSIWGATHRHAGFLGYGQRAEDCIEQTLACRPCSIYGNRPCSQGNYPCLRNISPEAVAKRVLEALAHPD